MGEWISNSKGELERTFQFKNFRAAIGFISQVSLIAEKHNHHPRISVDFNKVTIQTISHDVNKLTDRDTKLIEAIDKI